MKGAEVRSALSSPGKQSPDHLRTHSLFIVPGTPRGRITVWLTGLSGAGKSTIAHSARSDLLGMGAAVELLDADHIRQTLNADLGFNKKDREENVRRIAFIAGLLTRHGVIVLVAAISPYRSGREKAREAIGRFIEVHVNAPLAVCEARDPKGLYIRARRKEIIGFTGIDDPYEEPTHPEVRCDTHLETVQESVSKVVQVILHRVSEASALGQEREAKLDRA